MSRIDWKSQCQSCKLGQASAPVHALLRFAYAYTKLHDIIDPLKLRNKYAFECAVMSKCWLTFFLLAQRRKIMVYELFLIVGLPVLIMALSLLFYVLLLTCIINS